MVVVVVVVVLLLFKDNVYNDKCNRAKAS